MKEIRGTQIKYARTPLTCINEEGMSTVLMTKDLRLPCERGIKKALLERLITVAHTDSYLCEHAYTHISCVGDSMKYRVHTLGSACSSMSIIKGYIGTCPAHRGIYLLKKMH